MVLKKIELVMSRLWHYFSTNAFIFIMFILGSVVCSIGFIFFYGNTMQIKMYETGEGVDYDIRRYEINFRDPISQDDIFDSKLLKSDMIEDVEIQHKLPVDESSEIPLQYALCSRLYNNDKIICMQGRTDFSEDELESRKNVIILPSSDYYSTINIGDNITVENNEYNVIGVASFYDRFYITPKSYQSGGYSVDYISVLLSEQPSSAEAGKFAAELSKEFPTGELTSTPNDYYDTAQSNAAKDFLLVSLMFVISLLAFMFLMKFMLEQNNFETVIYTIVGATKKQIICIHLCETMVLSFIAAIIACLLHKSLYGVLFEHINAFSGIVYYFSDYFIIVLASVVISCLVSLPFVVSSMKNSIIRNKNKYS